MGVGASGVINYANVSTGATGNVVAYGGIGGPYETQPFFNALNWFAAGEQGAWYDPSDLTTLFQDSAGTTPVTAVEQPVGLMLDKSKGLALGAELVTNGDFSNGSTGWSVGAGVSVTSNSAVFTSVAGGVGLSQAGATFVTGNFYIVEWDVFSYTSGAGIFVRLGNAGNFYSTTPTVGHKRLIIPAGGSNSIANFVEGGTNGSYTLDNISVKQIAGNHAFQATAGNRPTLSARVNLLTKTEDFSDGVWAYLVNSTKVDYQTISFAGVGRFGAFGMSGITLGSSYTYSIEVKAGTKAGTIRLIDSDNPSPFVEVTLNSTWQKLTLQYSPVNLVYFSLQNTDGNAGTVLVRNADLRPTNAGALLPPYQRVNTASDYDTVGFPLYLKANGTSSAMSTNSIDFTATDKMTVVTGVRKLSDADQNVMSLGPLFGVGSFEISSPNSYLASSAANFYWLLAQGPTSTTMGSIYATPFVAPISSVLSCNFNFGGATLANQILPRVNGVIPTLAASTLGTYAGTGNFGNYPLYLFTRAGTSLYLNGQFYGAIIRGAQSDNSSVIQTEQYMAQKTGITF